MAIEIENREAKNRLKLGRLLCDSESVIRVGRDFVAQPVESIEAR